MDKEVTILSVTNDKDVAIKGAIPLAEEGDGELGIAFYFAPATRKHVAHLVRTSPYQTIKEVFSGTPGELIELLVETVGSYHPILKQAVNEAANNDKAFANAAFTAY